jgi:ClpP class serine protease
LASPAPWKSWAWSAACSRPGENKGFLDPFSPQTSNAAQYAQTMLDQIHQQFIAVVKAGRGDRLKTHAETFSGLFWTGQQAMEMGLADKLGSLDYVAREVVKAEDIIDYTRRENVAERLVKRFGAGHHPRRTHWRALPPSLKAASPRTEATPTRAMWRACCTRGPTRS